MSQACNAMFHVAVTRKYDDINRIPSEAAVRWGAAVAKMAGAGAR